MSKHSCADILADVYQFIDGELDADACDRIKGHLAECLQCLEAFDFEAELKRKLRERARIGCPDELRDRLIAALADGPTHA